MTKPVPHEDEAVRLDVKRAEAASQHLAQLVRGGEQLGFALSVGACESEKQRRDRWLLHTHSLAPPGFGFGKKHGDPAADRSTCPQVS